MKAPPEAVATYELRGRRAKGKPFPVDVTLGQPVRSLDLPHSWSCAVSVAPLWPKQFQIVGEGSFQAICLGAKHAVQMLATFSEQEGTLEYPDGEAFDASVFGFRLLPPT